MVEGRKLIKFSGPFVENLTLPLQPSGVPFGQAWIEDLIAEHGKIIQLDLCSHLPCGAKIHNHRFHHFSCLRLAVSER